MPRCSIIVARRYSRSGQCEKRRNVKRVQVGDSPVLLCPAHEQAIKGASRKR